MTSHEAEKTIENFLKTLDEFGITSPEPNHYNYLPNEWLYNYWDEEGAIDRYGH